MNQNIKDNIIGIYNAIDNFDFIIRDCRISTYISMKLSMNLYDVDISSSGYLSGNLNGLIINEIVNNLSRAFKEELYKNSTIGYIDISDNVNEVNRFVKCLSIITNSKYNNLISNGSIISDFKFTDSFKPVVNDIKNRTSSSIHNIGGLYGTQLFLDPYMIDDDLILFNNCYYNIEIDNFEVVEEKAGRRLNLSYRLGFDLNDTKIEKFISNTDNDDYRRYISIKREEKINNILND